MAEVSCVLGVDPQSGIAAKLPNFNQTNLVKKLSQNLGAERFKNSYLDKNYNTQPLQKKI
jgi:hypothetical protein